MPQKIISFFYQKRVREVLYQVLVTGIIALLGYYLVSNTLDNLERQGIATGYDFLELEASFGISEHVIDYSPADTYGKALLVGVLNTLKVSAIGIVFATLLGVFFGIAALSENWLLSRISAVYINMFRNIPVLLQLIFWYTLLNNGLPSPKQALEPLKGVFISNRGIVMPIPEYHPAYLWMLGAFFVGLVISGGIKYWAEKRQEQTGEAFPYVSAGIGLTFLLMIITYLVMGAPTGMDVPALRGFNFRGGWQISPEFTALLVGLTLYTATYIADIVRSGIEAVPLGQKEAASALGLKYGKIMRLITLPQALRIIIPPLTSQYLNLVKNSSLAVAIGYPDLVSISNTTLNQTGQAIEAISIFMGIYLSLSLSISLFMNWYNSKKALVGR